MIGHSGEDGRYVNSPEKSGGVAFKDERWRGIVILTIEKVAEGKRSWNFVAITEKSHFFSIFRFDFAGRSF